MRISESSSVVIRRSAGGSERGASSLSGVKPSGRVHDDTPVAITATITTTTKSNNTNSNNKKIIYAHNDTHDVALFFSLVNASVKARGKPTLQMVYSCDKRGELYHDEQMTTAKTCSHGRTPNSTIAGGTTEKV